MFFHCWQDTVFDDGKLAFVAGVHALFVKGSLMGDDWKQAFVAFVDACVCSTIATSHEDPARSQLPYCLWAGSCHFCPMPPLSGWSTILFVLHSRTISSINDYCTLYVQQFLRPCPFLKGATTTLSCLVWNSLGSWKETWQQTISHLFIWYCPLDPSQAQAM